MNNKFAVKRSLCLKCCSYLVILVFTFHSNAYSQRTSYRPKPKNTKLSYSCLITQLQFDFIPPGETELTQFAYQELKLISNVLTPASTTTYSSASSSSEFELDTADGIKPFQLSASINFNQLDSGSIGLCQASATLVETSLQSGPYLWTGAVFTSPYKGKSYECVPLKIEKGERISLSVQALPLNHNVQLTMHCDFHNN